MILAVALFVSAKASALTLYDGSAGTSPQSQGWLAYYSLPGTGVQTVAAGKTTYDSTASATESGGFSNDTLAGTPVNASFPTLNRTTGYTVSVNLKELSESHLNNNRAGLSLIVLSSDSQGVELAFWPNEIWAQAVGFTHTAETATFNTTAANTTYDVSVLGSNYTLSANGNPILSGPLRSYGTPAVPYGLTSYIFVGDDTTSAAGSFEMSRLAVTVPEPASAAAVALLSLVGLRRRRA
jgi:hypothetical protein